MYFEGLKQIQDGFVYDFPEIGTLGQGAVPGKRGKILPAQVHSQKLVCGGLGENYLVIISDLTEMTTLRKQVHDLEKKLESVQLQGEDCLLEKAEWEIVQLETRLQETENYLENILRTSGECVIVTDCNNTIIRINAALVDTLGYGIEELLEGRGSSFLKSICRRLNRLMMSIQCSLRLAERCLGITSAV